MAEGGGAVKGRPQLQLLVVRPCGHAEESYRVTAQTACAAPQHPPVGTVPGVHIRALAHEQLHQILAALAGRPAEGRQSAPIGSFSASPMLQEDLCRRTVTAVRGHVQRRAQLRIWDVYICTAFLQISHSPAVAGLDRQV